MLVKAGDINGDGFVDMKDVLLLRKYIAGYPIDNVTFIYSAADLVEDTAINMKDVLKLRKCVAGY